MTSRLSMGQPRHPQPLEALADQVPSPKDSEIETSQWVRKCEMFCTAVQPVKLGRLHRASGNISVDVLH